VLGRKSRWRAWNVETKNSISVSFRLFGVAQGSKVCCMFRKAWNIIQISLSNRLFRIWWNMSVKRVGGERSEALWSIWTMHDRTTAEKARQLWPQQNHVESMLQLTIEIHLRVASSSLEWSRNECREHHTARQMNWFLL
jgi:hypothetical protein